MIPPFFYIQAREKCKTCSMLPLSTNDKDYVNYVLDLYKKIKLVQFAPGVDRDLNEFLQSY